MRASFLSGIRVKVFLILCLLLVFQGCSTEQEANVWRLSGQTMGTTYHVTVVNQRVDLQSSAVQQGIDERLREVNRLASTYIDDSTLNQINQSPVNTWQVIPAELFSMLEVSRSLYEMSDGAYDITVGPLVDYWGFGAGKTGGWQTEDRPLIESEVKNIQARVGMVYLQMNPAEHSILRQKPVELDLSSIAKGYGVDVVAEYLSAQGINDYLVEIGGEVRVAGVNPKGRVWTIGIETPALGHEGVVQALPLKDQAVATSGDYRNYYEDNGQRVSHTIDPRTGFPITHNLASVTVVADNTALADGLATMFSVLGYEKSRAVAEEHQIPAYFLVRENEQFIAYHSTAFAPFLRKLN